MSTSELTHRRPAATAAQQASSVGSSSTGGGGRLSSRRGDDAQVYDDYVRGRRRPEDFTMYEKAAMRRHMRRQARDSGGGLPLSIGARLDLLVYLILFGVLYVAAKVEYKVDLIEYLWEHVLKPNY